MRKGLTWILIFVWIFAVAGCSSASKSSADIAVVNGEKITQKQFDEHYMLLKTDYEQQQGIVLDETKDKLLIDQIKAAVFDDLIMQTLLRQAANKQNVTVSSSEIDNVIKNYQQLMTQMKISENELRSQIEIIILSNRMQDIVAGHVEISEAEAQKYYQENKDIFKDPGGIQIYHILVATETQANEVLAKIKQGEDFGKLAQQYSTDPGSKDKGGDLGLVNQNTNFVPEFKNAALALQPGEVSQPVKSTYGYHVIKAGSRQAAAQKSYQQVKEQILEQLSKEQKDKIFDDYLATLKNEAAIQDLRDK